uniref:L1 transposable element RRM domain-containing protein n=1 Tax=Pygocentrus nattereri TaxID=42514 RepID=A0AAR2KUE7_PYGNA
NMKSMKRKNITNAPSPPRVSVAALRADFASIFKDEIRVVFESEISAIKQEMQDAKTEISNFKTDIRKDVEAMENTMEQMERGLSGCSDDVVALQRTVQQLSNQVAALEDKCEDLEGRSRRNNIRIIGVPEGVGSCSVSAVSALLKDAFQLEKAPLLDRAHRTLQPPPKQGATPRAIVARLHYFHDCSNILRLARERKRVAVNDLTISVYPDYTAKVARARAAFNDIRQQLRGIEGLRFGILHPARLRITYKGVEKNFTSPVDAQKYIAQDIIK